MPKATFERRLVKYHRVFHIISRVRDHSDHGIRALRILIESVVNIPFNASGKSWEHRSRHLEYV